MSNSGSVGSPSVFVSYAHESARHRDQVIEFASFLHEQGVVAVLDAWLGSARQDWYAWALREMTGADYVIVVASERYKGTLMNSYQAVSNSRNRRLSNAGALFRSHLEALQEIDEVELVYPIGWQVRYTREQADRREGDEGADDGDGHDVGGVRRDDPGRG
jgi:hypothetical protein